MCMLTQDILPHGSSPAGGSAPQQAWATKPTTTATIVLGKGVAAGVTPYVQVSYICRGQMSGSDYSPRLLSPCAFVGASVRQPLDPVQDPGEEQGSH